MYSVIKNHQNINDDAENLDINCDKCYNCKHFM